MEYGESSNKIINFNDLVVGLVAFLSKIKTSSSTATKGKYALQQIINSASSRYMRNINNFPSPVDTQYIYYALSQYLGDEFILNGGDLDKTAWAVLIGFVGDIVSNFEVIKRLNFAGL